MLAIRESKFGKSRQVPVLRVHAARAATATRGVRDQFCARDQRSSSFFVSLPGTRVIYRIVQQTFRRLCDSAGSEPMPRRRRGFTTCGTLSRCAPCSDWYRSGADVEARLPSLSTYLGHRDPRSTYWYLSAAPELLALAARAWSRRGR